MLISLCVSYHCVFSAAILLLPVLVMIFFYISVSGVITSLTYKSAFCLLFHSLRPQTEELLLHQKFTLCVIWISEFIYSSILQYPIKLKSLRFQSWLIWGYSKYNKQHMSI